MSTPLKPPFVIVFVQAHCPACHEFLPRFKAIAAPYQHCGMQMFVPDVSRQWDHSAQESANQFEIKATPTMVVVSRSGAVKKLEGSVSDARIAKALAASCQ